MVLDKLRNVISDVADSAIKLSKDMNLPSTEVFVLSNSLSNISNIKGKIESRDGLIQGIGVRGAEGKKIGFASCSGFEPSSIKSTLKKASSVARANKENPMFNGFAAESKSGKEGILDPAIANLDGEKIIELLNIMHQEIDYSDRRIISVASSINTTYQGYALATTEGCLASSLLTSFSASTITVVEEVGDRKIGTDFVIEREIRDVDGITSKAISQALGSLGSKAFEGTEVLPVIWEHRTASEFLSFALPFLLSGTTYVQQSNPWKNSLNEKVAVKEFAIIDDGVSPDYIPTQAIDVEGTPKKKTSVIENGVLQTFLFNKMYGHAAQRDSRGNASRSETGGANYESVPGIAPNKLIVKKIGKNLESQIENIDRGIYLTGLPVGLFTANPVTGDFSCTSNDSFLIEKGEIKYPLKSISIAGNYFKSFNDMLFIGSDLEKTSFPVVSPTITFNDHTISA